MRLSDMFSARPWLLMGILLGILLCCLFMFYTNRTVYPTEAFCESTDVLPNPYQGFYHIVGYTLSDNYDPTATALSQANSYQAPLVLLEINLKNYRTTEISTTGLAQCNDILTAWSKSPHNTKVILRFLYDWDGLALATEPESLDIILTHMDQVSPLVNQYRDTIYLMQGIFTGSWAEMHHSHFMDAASVQTLSQHLNQVIHPSIYLSVRTPAHWRMITEQYDVPEQFPAFGADDSLMGRLGLFNDGILGSESDLGTYGNTPRQAAASPFYLGPRDEELAFQNKLCCYVPNGGEVIYHPTFSDLETAVASLRTMHVSYLNADYDGRVLEKWRNTTWMEQDAFYGCDGYSYIKAHLGYRYFIDSCNLRASGWLHPKVHLTLTMENSGFSNTLKYFRTSLTFKHAETGTCTTIPLDIDLRTLGSGQKKSFTAKIPVKDLEQGCYQIYLSVIDETSGQQIFLANTNELTENGYLLGQLEL